MPELLEQAPYIIQIRISDIMEKYAFEIVEDVLEKFARSYNAKRKKQYWQMMKDIHGGTDKAVENITKGRHMDSLLARRPSWQWDYDQQFGNYG